MVYIHIYIYIAKHVNCFILWSSFRYEAIILASLVTNSDPRNLEDSKQDQSVSATAKLIYEQGKEQRFVTKLFLKL